MQGPNVKKLICHKIAIDAIPPGTPEGKGLGVGIGFLLDKDRVIATAKAASEWVTLVIQAVRDAPGDNPWRTATDEQIAGHILQKVEERHREQAHRSR